MIVKIILTDILFILCTLFLSQIDDEIPFNTFFQALFIIIFITEILVMFCCFLMLIWA